MLKSKPTSLGTSPFDEENHSSDSSSNGFFHKMKEKKDVKPPVLLGAKTKPPQKLVNIGKNNRFNSKNKAVCQYWINGACHKGNECGFSHDSAQVKKPNVFFLIKELCKFFLTNNCYKDKDCLYSHDLSQFPCKFFHAIGFCDKGELCK